MKFSTLLMASAFTFTLLTMTSGCNTIKNMGGRQPSTTETVAKTPAKDPESAPSDLSALAGEWSIVEVDGKTVVVNGENHPKITFQKADGRDDVLNVIGFNGCNYLNGAWRVKGRSVTPEGEMLSSMKSCDDAPYEYAVNLALNNVVAYNLTDGGRVMALVSATGKTLVKLRRQDLAFLNGAWKVTSIEAQPVTATIKFVIDTEEGRIHGNAGCNLLNGDIIVNFDKGNGIEFQNLATSRMMCPDIAVEKTFLLALENVSTAVKGTNTDQALLKNAAGQTVMTLERLSPDEIAD